jgi:hypothetical protein
LKKFLLFFLVILIISGCEITEDYEGSMNLAIYNDSTESIYISFSTAHETRDVDISGLAPADIPASGSYSWIISWEYESGPNQDSHTYFSILVDNSVKEGGAFYDGDNINLTWDGDSMN